MSSESRSRAISPPMAYAPSWAGGGAVRCGGVHLRSCVAGVAWSLAWLINYDLTCFLRIGVARFSGADEAQTTGRGKKAMANIAATRAHRAPDANASVELHPAGQMDMLGVTSSIVAYVIVRSKVPLASYLVRDTWSRYQGHGGSHRNNLSRSSYGGISRTYKNLSKIEHGICSQCDPYFEILEKMQQRSNSTELFRCS